MMIIKLNGITVSDANKKLFFTFLLPIDKKNNVQGFTQITNIRPTARPIHNPYIPKSLKKQRYNPRGIAIKVYPDTFKYAPTFWWPRARRVAPKITQRQSRI